MVCNFGEHEEMIVYISNFLLVNANILAQYKVMLLKVMHRFQSNK